MPSRRRTTSPSCILPASPLSSAADRSSRVISIALPIPRTPCDAIQLAGNRSSADSGIWDSTCESELPAPGIMPFEPLDETAAGSVSTLDRCDHAGHSGYQLALDVDHENHDHTSVSLSFLL